jgi:hypothetical protein
MNVEEILAERQKVHGEFRTHAQLAQALKAVVWDSENALRLTPVQREGLEMILHKVARILNGNPDHKDHWDDIAGYATLVAKEMPCGQSTTQT